MTDRENIRATDPNYGTSRVSNPGRQHAQRDYDAAHVAQEQARAAGGSGSAAWADSLNDSRQRRVDATERHNDNAVTTAGRLNDIDREHGQRDTSGDRPRVPVDARVISRDGGTSRMGQGDNPLRSRIAPAGSRLHTAIAGASELDSDDLEILAAVALLRVMTAASGKKK